MYSAVGLIGPVYSNNGVARSWGHVLDVDGTAAVRIVSIQGAECVASDKAIRPATLNTWPWPEYFALSRRFNQTFKILHVFCY